MRKIYRIIRYCSGIRVVFIAFALLLIVPAYSLHVECIGNAYMYVNQGDTVFIFPNDVGLKTKDGSKVTWYNMDGTEAKPNDTYLDRPNDGGYYIIVNGQKEYFYVFSYPDYRPQDLSLEVEELHCRSTQLKLSGTIPDMTYKTPDGGNRTVPRMCSISYSNVAWNSSDLVWQDADTVLQNETFRIGSYTIPAIYKATDISLAYDTWAGEIGLSVDSVTTTLAQPIAVKTTATSTTTTRGSVGDLSNEVERPLEESVLSGSAPLDILFTAYPTPAVDFFLWYIYKGSNRIAQRTDEQQRYSFESPGSYKVVLYVSNAACPCQDPDNPDCEQDSVEFTIAVSESQLLVPNVFTPNGDGVNDEFRVLYRSLKEFNIWVYNRWGKLVYQSNDPSKGWDGTINGRKAAEGAYFYVIRALGTDATAGYSNKIAYKKTKNKNPEALIGVYQLSGDINLIR